MFYHFFFELLFDGHVFFFLFAPLAQYVLFECLMHLETHLGSLHDELGLRHDDTAAAVAAAVDAATRSLLSFNPIIRRRGKERNKQQK